MKKKRPGFTDLFKAWQFLENHPIFIKDWAYFRECLSIDVVKVNPKTERVEDDPRKNTATRVWLECGPWVRPRELPKEERKYHRQGMASHDIDLDCGGTTFEEAIVKLANLVIKRYGRGRRPLRRNS